KRNIRIQLVDSGHGLLLNRSGLTADDDKAPGLAPGVISSISDWIRAAVGGCARPFDDQACLVNPCETGIPPSVPCSSGRARKAPPRRAGEGSRSGNFVRTHGLRRRLALNATAC